MSGHIVVVGSINMDLVVRSPRHPEPGETILGTDFQTFPGGKGANQAVASARLGGNVMMVGRVGTDPFGEVMLNNLRKEGIDTSYVLPTPGIASGVALITVSDSGQNNIVVVPGANWKLTPEDIRNAEQAFINAQVVMLQLEIPLDTVIEAARMGKKHSAQVILNPAPARQLPAELFSDVAYLIPNENELNLLTEMESIEIAANSLKSIGLGCLIVTLGADGALILKDETSIQILPHSVIVVDTTAAGDAFVGAFSVAITEGQNVLDAVAFGNAAGALAVTTAGAQPSLPTRLELTDFMACHPAKFTEVN